MEQPSKWSELNPRDCLQVTQRVWLTQRELQFVTQLYVPFLGTKATALYLVLFSELSPNSYESEVFRLADLLAMVNLGIPDFYQARIRLESVGLLKTYRVEDEASVSTQYTLELQAPASPSLFFKDALLATLLLNQVGHQRFEGLRKRYLRHTFSDSEAEITATFQEGFQLPFNLQHYQRHVSAERDMVQDVRQQDSFQPKSDLDWELLTDLLKSQFIKADSLTLEVKQLMESFRLAYGLSEKEIAQYAIYAADLSIGEIDADELRKIVIEASQQLSVSQQKVAERQKDSPPSDVQQSIIVEEKKENSTSKKINDQESQMLQLLIKYANDLSPYEFIRNIKDQKNGFVSRGEQQLILDLLSATKLPAPVINILIHYVLVTQGKSDLSRNFVDTIANDWSQAGVSTPEEAVAYVRNRKNQKQAEVLARQANAGRKRYTNQRNGRVEIVPDWSKQDDTTKDTQMDADTLKSLQSQIANLKTSKSKK